MAIMLRDIQTRRSHSRLRYVLAIVEPCMQLLLMYIIFVCIGRRPDFGNNLFVFLASGILPYFLFTHIAGRLIGVIGQAKPFRPLRKVSAVDLGIAGCVLETLTIVIIGTFALGIAYAAGVLEALPKHVPALLLSVLALSLCAFGVGLCNSAISVHFDVWRTIWTVVARSLLFFSNVFYVVDFLPQRARDILWWNPVLHGVILFRSGVFQNYPMNTFSGTYLFLFCISAVAIGLALERRLRARP